MIAVAGWIIAGLFAVACVVVVIVLAMDDEGLR